MRILIATDGLLPVEPTVEHLERLYQAGDTVTVMTAINMPRRFLDQLKAVTSGSKANIDEIVEAAGPGFLGMAGGDRIAERLLRRSGEAPVDDFMARYRSEVVRTVTQPMIDELAAVGIEANSMVRETENKTAITILSACREKRIDLLVIGATGQGRFEGLVGSTATKLFRHAPCSVHLIRLPHAS